jgi:hypothetical protein
MRLRKNLARASTYESIQALKRIIDCGAVEQPVFADLMRTPRMREPLSQWSPDIISVRSYAGVPQDGEKKRRRRLRSDPDFSRR